MIVRFDGSIARYARYISAQCSDETRTLTQCVRFQLDIFNECFRDLIAQSIFVAEHRTKAQVGPRATQIRY